MGTYTSLYLNGYELISSKSDVIPEVMTVFVESDRKVLWRLEGGGVVDGPSDSEDVYVNREVVYEVSAQSAARRLDVIGFTLSRCKREYEEIRAVELAYYRDEATDSEPESTTAFSADSWAQQNVRLLEFLNFEAYTTALRSILDRGLLRYQLLENLDISTLSLAERHLLNGHDDDWPFHGFFCADIRCFIRVALSVAPAQSTLSQDISALVSGGYFGEADPVRDMAVRKLLERYPENAPRILLTEGKSDANTLEKALRLLHPELVGYYTFFDFDGANTGGGASRLVQAVKAFSAAGVANRVIAILDNDGAAHEAARGLKGIVLPPNLVVRHYPKRDWMRNYQAPGPREETVFDLNGTAGSLEMYFGRDILCANGVWEPISWGGTSTAPQGELVNKDLVATRWRAKAERCLVGSQQVVKEDWEDLRAIWESIFRSFDDH